MSEHQTPGNIGGQSQTANVEAESVETNIDGDDQSEKGRQYNATQVNELVLDRLAQQKRQFAKREQELLAQLEDVKKPSKVSPNLEEAYKTKLSEYESKSKAQAEQIDRYRQQTLKTTIEKELAQQGCIDPELVSDHFVSKGLVKLDDDGNVVVEDIGGKLDIVVKEYLATKPHLRVSTNSGGAGTKAPKTPATSTLDGKMSIEEFEQTYGISRKQYKR